MKIKNFLVDPWKSTTIEEKEILEMNEESKNLIY